MNTEQITVLTFSRFHVPSFHSSDPQIFNQRHLFLKRPPLFLKQLTRSIRQYLPITPESRHLCPLKTTGKYLFLEKGFAIFLLKNPRHGLPSPVSGCLSMPSPEPGTQSSPGYPVSCIVHGPPSIVRSQPSNLPPSILPTAELILGKVNSNNNSKQFPKPLVFPLFAPDTGLPGREKDRIIFCLLRIVPIQLGDRAAVLQNIMNGSIISTPSPRRTTPRHPSSVSCLSSIIHHRFSTFKRSNASKSQRNQSSQRFSGSTARTLTTEYPQLTRA